VAGAASPDQQFGRIVHARLRGETQNGQHPCSLWATVGSTVTAALKDMLLVHGHPGQALALPSDFRPQDLQIKKEARSVSEGAASN
jgi:hypothetical protein